MAIYRGSQKMSRINCAGNEIEWIFHGTTLVFAAHDRVRIMISCTVPLSLYSGNTAGTPLSASDGTSLVSYSGEGSFYAAYNSGGFYLAPVSGAGDLTISVTLLNYRGETVQTLTLTAAQGGTFTIPRYGSVVIEEDA